MKERAAELRAEGKKGAKKADGLQAVIDQTAKMAPEDRALAERVHVPVNGHAPRPPPQQGSGTPAHPPHAGQTGPLPQAPAMSPTHLGCPRLRPWCMPILRPASCRPAMPAP